MPIEVILALSLASNLINRLPDLAINEIGNVWNVEKNLRSLAFQVAAIQNKLNQIGNEELSKAKWRPWLQNLTKLFYEVEDVIDDINIRIMKDELEKKSRSREMVAGQNFRTRVSRAIGFMKKIPSMTPTSKDQVRKSIFSSFNQMSVPTKINTLLTKFMDLEHDVKMMSPGPSNRLDQLNSTGPNGVESGFNAIEVQLTETREEEKQIIRQCLLERPSGTRGVSIFGMAGSGKTTLARSIQRDVTIKGYFDHVVWVSVPKQNFNLESTTWIQDGEGHPLVNRSINSLIQREGNTLLMLDDIWNTQYHIWKDLASHNPTLTLLITTRDPRVARITETHCHKIERLSATECKELIDNELPPYFLNRFDYSIAILAEKCSGLPLVAKELGRAIGSMSNHGGISRFIEINDLWDLEIFRDVIFPKLKFDDPALPPELSKCLAYMTLFPKDHEFKREELAQLWLAEGFLPPYDETWTSEKLIKAGDYFDDLHWRSILQPSNDGQPEKKLVYEMHEFLRGFAKSMAFNICHHAEDGTRLFTSLHILHLSICCQTIEEEYLNMISKYCKRLRTFLLLHKHGTNINQIPEYLFQRLDYLRVVNLTNSGITRLPNSIGNLRHLRCLDASNTHLKTLNDKLCGLFSLRILRLTGCSKLLCLPQDIGKLVNLIFLEVDMQSLRVTPQCIGSLTKLRALEDFVCTQEEGKRVSELRNMNDLRGSIRIMCLENIINNLEARGAELIRKDHLKGLELHWTKTSHLRNSNEYESILTELEPNDALEDLKLMCYYGSTFPSWLSSNTRNLKNIRLYDCPNIKNLSIFWALPYLDTLVVDKLSQITKIDRNFFGHSCSKRFVKLEILEFLSMNLESWEAMIPGDFPRLRHLAIVGSPNLTELPTFGHLPQHQRPEVSRWRRQYNSTGI